MYQEAQVIQAIREIVLPQREYQNKKQDIIRLGKNLMQVLGENKYLLLEYENAIWQANLFCLEYAFNLGANDKDEITDYHIL